jgi:hypothetical protein
MSFSTYLPTQATLSRRQPRSSESLQRLPTLSWHHNPGRINVADPVSRAANLLTDCAAAPAGPWALLSKGFNDLGLAAAGTNPGLDWGQRTRC